MAKLEDPDIKKLLTAEQATQFARSAANDFLESRMKVALNTAQATSPRLVQRIDRKDDYYFIVPFTIGPRETARFIVDGFDGSLVEASGVATSDAAMPRYVAATES